MRKHRPMWIAIGTIVGLFLLIQVLALVGCVIFDGPKYRGPKSDHYNGKEFFNPGEDQAHGFKDVLKWSFNREPGKWSEWTDVKYGEAPPESAPANKVRVTFINHSSLLIQTETANILTDPVWSERASPVSWTGPRRRRPPGIQLTDLPKIDAVIISHNHYDHLDLKTLIKLRDLYDPEYVVPLGNKPLLTENGMEKVVELDWWQKHNTGSGTPITFVPTTHFSGRGLRDRNRTLWGGYIVHADVGNIFFMGDTGWGHHFEEIHRKFGPLLVATIPIGAYRPEWFMSPVHLSPKQAVDAHILLEAKQSIAIHFETFPLADDGENEPREELISALKEKLVPLNSFLLLENGQAVEISPLIEKTSDSK